MIYCILMFFLILQLLQSSNLDEIMVGDKTQIQCNQWTLQFLKYGGLASLVNTFISFDCKKVVSNTLSKTCLITLYRLIDHLINLSRHAQLDNVLINNTHFQKLAVKVSEFV